MKGWQGAALSLALNVAKAAIDINIMQNICRRACAPYMCTCQQFNQPNQPAYRNQQVRPPPKCPKGCTKSCCVRCPPGCLKQCCINKQVLVYDNENKKMLVWDNNVWKDPKIVPLTKNIFDLHQLSLIQKVKCIKKLQPYSDQLNPQLFMMKVKIGSLEVYYSSLLDIIEEYFVKIVLARMHSSNIPQFIYSSKPVQGIILKKSYFFGTWEDRYVVINQTDGLKSHPKKNQPHTLHIKSAKEIWTWFQVHQTKYLIIKIKSVHKTQFAIPLSSLHIWVPAFYGLFRRTQQ